jgi:hypothetical protein
VAELGTPSNPSVALERALDLKHMFEECSVYRSLLLLGVFLLVREVKEEPKKRKWV